MFVEHKEAMEVHEAPAKIGRLSDAIREGSRLFPKQGTSWDAGNPCALCGAAYAIGWDGNGTPDKLLCSRWPELTRPIEAPIPEAQAFNLFVTVEALNGFRGNVNWPRERIADWLESKGF